MTKESVPSSSLPWRNDDDNVGTGSDEGADTGPPPVKEDLSIDDLARVADFVVAFQDVVGDLATIEEQDAEARRLTKHSSLQVVYMPALRERGRAPRRKHACVFVHCCSNSRVLE